MANQSNIKFLDSTITIEENTFRWENHMIKTADISQIWMGSCPHKSFPVQFVLLLLLIALSGNSPANIIGILVAVVLYPAAWLYWDRKQTRFKGINVEINSGKTYSFICNNEEFTREAYDLISGLISKNNYASKFQISFLGDGKLIDNSEPEKESFSGSQIMNIMASGINEPIIRELQKLYAHYTENNEINNEILILIEKTIHSLNANDKIEVTKSLSNFITMGLIKDCNELGLNALINEIKANIY
ncbi:DUF6232 family protein [Lacrimispora saccharolytica]|uniref:Uncharacterized protein n=1 Tax=Lacrimispora saccharolytica (strain ATCC 35040 / DSM 2544 / NRCC 2533 / WM1) TaxID=610130 RepID=D9QZ56_LACSW|nr:DUF6232 family protein [Lacrimispora saccharolytica]ADL04307.1 hypothetical protein Closa_1711 [[Clostridium] saccharolyticum WM1]QRV21420.1 hypothetical protein I6K70_08210 [Lacrimispora saccharolytica]